MKEYFKSKASPCAATKLAFFFLCTLLSSLGLGLYFFEIPFLPQTKMGDIYYPTLPTVSTAETAREIWEHGTIERPSYYKLDAYFKELSLGDPSQAYWQDVYGHSRSGALLPKHPLIISVIGAPFYGLFGYVGIWLLNQLFLLVLFFYLYRILHETVTVYKSLFFCALAALSTSIIWRYTYSFSYDLLSTSLIISGFFYLKKFPFLAGLLFGLSLYVRMTNALFLPFLVLACYPVDWKNFSFIKSWSLCVFGFLSVVTPYLFTNFLVFGNAIKGSYTNVPVYLNGETFTDEKTGQFHWNFLLNEPIRLWGNSDSLLNCYPLLLIILLLIPFLLFLPKQNYIIMITLGSLTQIGLFLCYSFWTGAGGDRFVQAAVLLLFIPAAYVVDSLLKLRKKLIPLN